MNDLCRSINRRISALKNDAFQFNYSMKQGKIYIIFPIDSESVILNDNLRQVLGFKQSIINGRSAAKTSGMDCVIFADYPPGFSTD